MTRGGVFVLACLVGGAALGVFFAANGVGWLVHCVGVR